MKRINILVLVVLLITMIYSPVYAEQLEVIQASDDKDIVESKANILTYEDAVELAISKSTTLKSMSLDIDKALEKRNKANETVGFFSLDAENNAGYFSLGGNVADALVSSSVNGLIALDRQWQISQKNYDLEKEKIAYKVLTAYHNVLKAQRDVDVATNALETAVQDNKIIDLKNQYGLASSFEKTQANQALIAANDAIKSKQAALDTKYLELNKMLSIDNIKDKVLVATTVMTDINNFDLETHISRIKNSSPTVWMFEQQAYLAQLSVDNYTFNQNTYDTYKVKKIEAEAARDSVNVHKQQLEDGMRSIYAGIEELESAYQELVTMEETLQKTYNNTKLLVDLGLVAKIELIKLEEQLNSLEVQKFHLTSQHQQLVYTLNKPWVMS